MTNLVVIQIDELKELLNDLLTNALQNFTPTTPPPVPEEVLITRKQTAEILGVSLTTLNDWTKQGMIPSYRIGNRVRYKKREVMDSLQSVKKYNRA